MAVVNKISINNIRSHELFEVVFSPKVTVITGKNGSGKTSILEALYLALRGRSFRGGDSDILKHESDWWRINLELNPSSKRIITFNPNLTSGRKKFNIDEKISYRLPIKNKYPVVLFEPEDLRLLNGSPARRRRFIDNLISQLDSNYSHALHKYERALKQRNNILKTSQATKDELFVWEIALSEYGAYLIEKRIAFIEQINNQITEVYNQIAKLNDSITVHYSHTHIGDIKQKLLNDLHQHQEKDRIIGFTSVGPHRHDVIFRFNESPAIDVASRGEIRSIVLALKFLEVDIIEKITDQKPIILLDDVFSELDDDRQKGLFLESHQVIITSTKLPDKLKEKIKTVTLK